MSTVDESNGVIRYTTKEILRDINESLTTIKNTQQSDGRRIDKLEEEQRLLGATLNRLVPQVNELMTGAKIGAAVHEALEQRTDRGFTRKEKVLGLLLALVAVGFSAYSALGH